MKTGLKNQTGTRDAFILKVLDKMLKLHKLFYSNKRKVWGISPSELQHYPKGSLGYELSGFLQQQHFHSIPMIERHDVFHLLFGFETHVKDEIAMLCFLVGNGKVTPFTSLSAFGSALFYPEHLLYFLHHFRRGRHAVNIRNWDFRLFLNEDIRELKEAIFLESDPRPLLHRKILGELRKVRYA